jgi:hypothetical protein
MITTMATADHDAKQRHLALTDCVDQTRRAASAALAAADLQGIGGLVLGGCFN